MRANLWLRTATRVTARLATFHARSFAELERHGRSVRWERYIAPGRAVQLRVTCRKSKLYHSDAVAERVARSIAQTTTDADVVPSDEDESVGSDAQLIIVRLFRDECTISVDSSGALLHRRGYRLAQAKAPLRETLAAAMVLASGWTPDSPLLDPFCGSGTVVIEAALLARGMAPGAHRDFAFLRWPRVDAGRWNAMRAAATAAERASAPGRIIASDRDAGAVASTLENATRAGVADDISLARRALSAIDPPAQRGWVVTNPPYGVRVGERDALRDLYAQLGNVARRSLVGWTVTMLSGDQRLMRQTALPFQPLLETVNGGLPVHLLSADVQPSSQPTRPG